MTRFTFLPAFLMSALLASTAWAQYGNVTPVPENLKPGFESITPEQCEQWLNVLAGPGFEGRGTGQVGYVKAASWVAGKLAEFGLEPIGDNGTYFQMLPMKRRAVVLEDSRIEGPDGLQIPAEGNLGFERFTDMQEIPAEIVFLNYSNPRGDLNKALEATAQGDGPAMSLRDKIVIYQADDDANSLPVQLARQRPAAAIRVIDGVPKSISQLIRGGGRTRNTSISGTITREAAIKLAKGLGGKESWVKADPANQVNVYRANATVTLRLRFREEQAAVPNVVAWLEGSDPKLRNEYVVIGSHLDHLGIRGGIPFPGADDNGSGSTAVLNIAKAMSVNPVKPKRSVLFIWFAAEEIGLVGSRHYSENPTVPQKDMICMFNIDMVGRNEETRNETAEENEGSIHLVGSKKGNTDLHGLVEAANKHVGFRFEYDEENNVFSRSDQYNFYSKGVPVAFLFGGFHPDYHRPSDQPAKINFDKIKSAARLYYLAIFEAAEHGPFEMERASGRRGR